MLAGATMSFTDLVLIGEMVENALKTGKLDDGESSATKESSKKEDTTPMPTMPIPSRQFHTTSEHLPISSSQLYTTLKCLPIPSVQHHFHCSKTKHWKPESKTTKEKEKIYSHPHDLHRAIHQAIE